VLFLGLVAQLACAQLNPEATSVGLLPPGSTSVVPPLLVAAGSVVAISAVAGAISVGLALNGQAGVMVLVTWAYAGLIAAAVVAVSVCLVAVVVIAVGNAQERREWLESPQGKGRQRSSMPEGFLLAAF
jgi:hypothetical protein